MVVNEAAGRQRPERQNFWQQVRHCTDSTLTTPGLTKEKFVLFLLLLFFSTFKNIFF